MYLLSAKLKNVFLTAIPFFIGFTNLAWSVTGTSVREGQGQLRILDTVPARSQNKGNIYDDRDKGPKDINQHLEQLDRAMEQLDKRLQEQDWDKMKQKLNESLSKIDVEKVQHNIDEAIKKIDVEKIRLEADEAFKKVNWDKIEKEIKEGMADAKNNMNRKEMEKDLQKAMKEARKSMEQVKKIDFDKIKAELEHTRLQLGKERGEIEQKLKETREELSRNKLNMQSGLEKAKEEIKASKEELVGYKSMISEMENDGLLNSKADYTIEFNKGELSINGKTQPEHVKDKYKTYFKKESLLIKNEKGNFQIHSNIDR